jgi:hypothetical protein
MSWQYSASPWIIKRVLGMVPIQKKGRSKRGHKDKVSDMALGSAPKSGGKKPSNRKKSNSQKPPVTETRDLLEGNRSVFVNPQAPVFPLNVVPVPILPAIQQQTGNNRLNSLFPEAAPHRPVIQNVFSNPNLIQSSSSFKLKWVAGTRVSRCDGCNGEIKNPPQTLPEDLIVVYRDIRQFRDRNTGQIQFSSEPQNVHFHLRSACIRAKYPSFLGDVLVVPPDFPPLSRWSTSKGL